MNDPSASGRAALHHVGAGCVYRLYDAEGELLYVGRTNNIWARMASHSRQSAWWDQAASVEWFDEETTAALKRSEMFVIASKGPPFNRHHHPDRARPEPSRRSW